jgi:hypothetical protein
MNRTFQRTFSSRCSPAGATALVWGAALLTALLWVCWVAPSPVRAQSDPVSGTYAGAVTVVEPAALGSLNLALVMTDTNSALTGKVVAARTQIFLGAPTFQGAVTAGNGITPTFRLDSQIFTGVVSGRQVQRQFTLLGEIAGEGDILRGTYAETITGFTPQPLMVRGRFLLVRPSGSTVVIDVPDLPDDPGNPGDPDEPGNPGDPDRTPPETTITAGPANPSGASVTIGFQGSDVGVGVLRFECALDGGAFAVCTNPQILNNLAPGEHTFRVRAVDRAGNVDATPAIVVWTVVNEPGGTDNQNLLFLPLIAKTG